MSPVFISLGCRWASPNPSFHAKTSGSAAVDLRSSLLLLSSFAGVLLIVSSFAGVLLIAPGGIPSSRV